MSIFLSNNVNEFSKLFFFSTLTNRLFQSNVTVTIAGYTWYDESAETVSSLGGAKVFLLAALIFELFVSAINVVTKSVQVTKFRRQVAQDANLSLPSRMGLLCSYHPHNFLNTLFFTVASIVFRGNFRPLVVNLLITFFLTIQGVAFVVLYTQFVGHFNIFLALLVAYHALVIVVFVISHQFQSPSNVITHVYLVGRGGFLPSFVFTLLEILFLVPGSSSPTVTDQRRQLGYGYAGDDYVLSGGTFDGSQVYVDLRDQTWLYSGMSPGEVIVYTRDEAVLRVRDADAEQVRALATAISYHTGEKKREEKLTLGTVPWTLALIDLAHTYFGPGPWPGVDGIDKSLIWLAVVTTVAAFLNDQLTLASFSFPLSGTTTTVSTPKHICKWIDGANQQWSIYSDENGVVRARALNVGPSP